LTDPDLRIPETTVETAWRLAATLTKDEAIGVHLAESLPRGALDLIEYAFRLSTVLTAGLERLARYGRVLSDRVAAVTETRHHGLRFEVRDTGSTALHPGRADFALAIALKFARESTGVDITPLEVCLAHQPPDDVSEYQRFFRVPVRFGAESNSIVLSSLDSARPMGVTDETLASIIRRRLDKALAERDPYGAKPLSGRVRQIMVEHIGTTMLTPDSVAKAFSVSRRTLSRRLRDEGASFRQILDDVRREVACSLLHDRTLSVSHVAFFLQYSEPAAFSRSFRRWTGRTPGAFRNVQ
jgi:AraC-like DNA-binding protein